uniref:Ionotropic glutamate receptor C-terminal domain-containing protein n=1 Tax=Dendroctonus ponderosae TaxID=77166 RepID=A0AAR5PZ02_DENPD
MQCPDSADILDKASNVNRFGKFEFIYSWYLLSKVNQELEDIFHIFTRFKTRMDMDVKVLAVDDFGRFEVSEIFNPGINVGLTTRRIGKLQNGSVIIDKNWSYYESRMNMTGVLIRSANVIRYPFTTSFDEYMTDPKLMKYDIYSKFHYQLFQGLVHIHGFEYNTSLPFSWFGNTSSGEDGGLAKMLWDDTIDISSAGCILRLLDSDRIDFYDYIMPYYKFRSCFFFRNPGVVKPNFYEALKPFDKQSWIVTLYVTGIVCICIEIAHFVETRHRGGDLQNSSCSFRSLFVVVAVFSQQGLGTIPSSISTRIILLHLLICSVLLYNYYTSSLVSSLISTEPEVMKTIKELLESNLKVGIELQPYTITYMLDRVKEDHYLNQLNQSKIFYRNTPNIFTAEEGIRLVHQGDFAFHTESITAYPLIADTFEQESVCNLAEIILINSDTSLMAQKKSQYKKLFQVSLRKMWQSGIIRKLHKTWVVSKPECLSSARIISVGINDLFLSYFLLAMGVFGALCSLIFELTWKRTRFWR